MSEHISNALLMLPERDEELGCLTRPRKMSLIGPLACSSNSLVVVGPVPGHHIAVVQKAPYFLDSPRLSCSLSSTQVLKSILHPRALLPSPHVLFPGASHRSSASNLCLVFHPP
jgi:hypothetical protein